MSGGVGHTKAQFRISGVFSASGFVRSGAVVCDVGEVEEFAVGSFSGGDLPVRLVS